jgi:hypothetical protein
MQEKITVGGNKIKIELLPQLNQNIRPIGEQIEKGKQALQKGTLLNAAAIGYLSALGSPDLIILCDDLIKDINHSSLLFSLTPVKSGPISFCPNL